MQTSRSTVTMAPLETKRSSTGMHDVSCELSNLPTVSCCFSPTQEVRFFFDGFGNLNVHSMRRSAESKTWNNYRSGVALLHGFGQTLSLIYNMHGLKRAACASGNCGQLQRIISRASSQSPSRVFVKQDPSSPLSHCIYSSFVFNLSFQEWLNQLTFMFAGCDCLSYLGPKILTFPLGEFFEIDLQ